MKKYAICNELFGDMSFADSCSLLQKHGYHGIEIAPFTLFDDPGTFTAVQVAEIRRMLDDHGLEFAGLHWLFLKPAGLHITTPDTAIRRRSWDHLRRLVELAGQLGGGVLVLGSPKQRGSVGISREQAAANLEEGLGSLAEFTARRNCAILLESLSTNQTDVVNTLAEAEQSIKRIGHPAIQGIFDFHNCADEPRSWEESIEDHYPIFRHVHLNEVNGSWPGTGDSDFLPAFKKLAEKGYSGWISLEIFQVPEDPERVLRETNDFLDRMEEALG
ncbi:MAG: sugar phosphate isomerase/epimerase [Spirochaetaceae bacterium]|nr:MAG: sugar phosphate isomerase/epimerase [Spirochaetaceae bacterium]